MLDYPKTKELFEEVADHPRKRLSTIFSKQAHRGRRRPQADDITLVVIKMK